MNQSKFGGTIKWSDRVWFKFLKKMLKKYDNFYESWIEKNCIEVILQREYL